MNFTMEEREGAFWLELHEEVTIQHVGDLKESLGQAVQKGLSLKVKAGRIQTTHTAVIQLFRVWGKSGRGIEIIEPSVEFKKCMNRLGIQA